MAFASSKTTEESFRAIFISSFIPRECGLATFTDDLVKAVSAHGVTCDIVAMNRPNEFYSYDTRVITTITENKSIDYLTAANIIKQKNYQVLSIQHEFGIYGGEECDYLLDLLDAIDIPVVTTLHTILRQPSPTMRRNLQAVLHRSAAIVVMNGLAIPVLASVYGVDAEKISMIHHGAPMPPTEHTLTIKKDLGYAGRKVISTFGLLSSGKGIEHAIQALPRIVEKHPEVIYLILGQTHPVVKQQEGEEYRESLQSLAHDLGVAAHVQFIDKYFSKAELMNYLLATDVYLTPYTNLEQVTSGTLAYAMACGRPIVSTPYLHAQFLLAEGRGLLVPPQDPNGMAEACITILDNPVLRAQMERTNWRYGQTMIWPRIGQEYLTLFQQVINQYATPTYFEPVLQSTVANQGILKSG